MQARRFMHATAVLLMALVTEPMAQDAQPAGLVVTRLVDRSEGLYAHDVTMARAGAQPLRLQWVDRLSEIRETSLYGTKLIALGAVQSSAEGFSVIEGGAKGQRPADAFVLGREPQVSPSGRFVSFLQFVPRQAQLENLGDILLIYDLLRPSKQVAGVSADEGWVSQASNQGVVVYPGSPQVRRVFPVGVAQPGSAPSEVRARTWTREGDVQLIVVVEGNDLVALAISGAGEGGFKVRQGRVGAVQTFGSAPGASWQRARVNAVAPSGADGVVVTFDAASGVPDGRLFVALR